jgi:hypothetical protein
VAEAGGGRDVDQPGGATLIAGDDF